MGEYQGAYRLIIESSAHHPKRTVVNHILVTLHVKIIIFLIVERRRYGLQLIRYQEEKNGRVQFARGRGGVIRCPSSKGESRTYEGKEYYS